MDGTHKFQMFKDMRTFFYLVPLGEIYLEDGRAIKPIIMTRTGDPIMLGWCTVADYDYDADMEVFAHVRDIGTEEALHLLAESLSESLTIPKISAIMQMVIEYSKAHTAHILDELVKDKPRVESIMFLRELKQKASGMFERAVPNIMALHERLLDEEITHRFLSAQSTKIQRRFRAAIADPSTKLCRNRLLHEYHDMI